jgi:anti-anti-sigma factor
VNFTTLEAHFIRQVIMEIVKEVRDKVVILSLTGRLDTLNFPVFDTEITSLLDKSQKDIILDCGDMDYVSSSGLRVLLKALKQAKAAGGKFVICRLQPQISQIFKISGFDQLFEIYPDKTVAFASFN